MDKDAYQKAIRARASLVLDHPFFGYLALRMKLAEDPTCDTAWSDGRTLAYNPLYVNMLPNDKLKGLMGHVVMHPACRHHLRRNGRDAGLWNMACDYAINWILLEAGLNLPDGYLDDPKLQGKTADDIYVHLLAERTRERSDNQDRRVEKQAMEAGEAVDVPEVDNRGVSKQRTGESEDGDVESMEAEAFESDGSDDDRMELDQGDPGRSGEVRDAPPAEEGAGGMGEETPEESQWRINLAQAASRARSMGDLPAGLVRLVESLLSPKLDWRQLLNRFIQASARCDYAWMPPNRRYIHQNLYLPAMRSTDLPEVVVAVDTSGSISARELDQFAAELSAILETCADTVHLLYCDSRVARAQTVQRQDLPLALVPIGGGGTDFRPAFDWVSQQGVQPLCMIYLTDLACNRFPQPPPYPMLWACVGEMIPSPPFGECITID
jgi:predicted metal-dependent peptidase